MGDLETRPANDARPAGPRSASSRKLHFLIAPQLVVQGRLGLNDTIDPEYRWIDDASLVTAKALCIVPT